MTAFADKVLSRLDRHDKAIVELSRERYPKQSRQVDNALGRAVDTLGEAWVACPIGTLVAGQVITATGLLDFATPYLALGVPIEGLPPVPGDAIVSVMPYVSALGTVYFFKWDAVNSKLIITDWTGLELAAATDISAIEGWPYTVYGEAGTDDHPFFRAPGPCVVREIALEAAEGVPQDADNYWTLEVRRRAADETLGETIGQIHRTSVYRIDAFEDTSLYPVETPTRDFVMAEDDRLFLRATATGAPQPLVGLTGWVRLQRRAR